jgi:hypothetical protein
VFLAGVCPTGDPGDALTDESRGVGHGPDHGYVPELVLISAGSDAGSEGEDHLPVRDARGDALDHGTDITGLHRDDDDFSPLDGFERVQRDHRCGGCGELAGELFPAHRETHLFG